MRFLQSHIMKLSLQGLDEGASQRRKWWVVTKAKQGFQQLQKLNLAFQDWTERFWKARHMHPSY